MSKRSIYGERNQVTAECFSRAGAPEKVMVVPMDLAKEQHVASLCLGTGAYLVKAFPVFNNLAGVDYLVKRIEGICKQYRIPRENVLIGGEDPGEYAFNFIHGLRLRAYPFLCVNAGKAATLRNNSRAVSDVLALDGIAQALVQQRGRTMEAFDGLYSTLKSAARSRRKLVVEETACKNRIHRKVDILFPGFLRESRTGIVPFSAASLDLMERDFSCVKVKRMRPETLVKRLCKGHVHHPEKTALKMKAAAEQVLPPPPNLIAYESKSLNQKVGLLRSLRAGIVSETEEMARCLVRTPGVFLTSVPGVGVVLAGHIMAEYGCPDHWPDADNMASYAGIVPRSKQTGGPAKPAKVGRLPRDANRILKDYLLQAAFHAGTTGSHRIQEHFQRVENREGRSRLSTAKLLVRVMRKMVKTEMIYLPDEILRPGKQLPPNYVIDYYREATEAMDRKWSKFDLSGIPDKDNRLIKWKETVDDIARFTARHS